jgi:hypothetical protein
MKENYKMFRELGFETKLASGGPEQSEMASKGIKRFFNKETLKRVGKNMLKPQVAIPLVVGAGVATVVGKKKEAAWSFNPLKKVMSGAKGVANELEAVVSQEEKLRQAAAAIEQNRPWLKRKLWGPSGEAKDLLAVADSINPEVSQAAAIRNAIFRAENAKKGKSHKFALGVGVGGAGALTVGSLFGKKNQNSPYYPQ